MTSETNGAVAPDVAGESVIDLTGKVAIVTGGATSLGAVYVAALRRAGAEVAVIDVDRAALDAPALAERGISTWCLDVADFDAVETAVSRIAERHAGVDILVNNAGLARAPYDQLTDLDATAWSRLLAVNVVAPVVWARACRSEMSRRGAGAVVNVSSVAAYALMYSSYAVSKAAVNAATVALAVELAADNIRVNAIAPGMMQGRVPEETARRVLALQALKRHGRPDDLVSPLLFLCSEMSRFMTGQVLSVDGGMRRS